MLASLSDQLARCSSSREKVDLLDSLPSVKSFFAKYPEVYRVISSVEQEAIVKQLIAIGQAEVLLCQGGSIQELFEQMGGVDRFYREIGGLVGYQAKILGLLEEKGRAVEVHRYHSPSFIDISEESAQTLGFVASGIEALPFMAEIYPLGGAADRLHLVDGATGVELPAAKLAFGGISLLEHLVRDLEAREALYFEKYGVRLVTPIAIMTSKEKNNHQHVLEICEGVNYFGRPKDSIRFFTQPLVPAVDEGGNWVLQGPGKPLLKPGGHGAIWKLARDEGIFSWLKGLGRTKALVRQINNPIAGLDYGLLAFIGIGWAQDMVFGFASCPRLLKAAEGVNVLVEKERHVVLTNVEYCDFEKFGIEDLPLADGSPYSRFSSNTNLLFVDLEAVEEAVRVCPFPGLLINLKKSAYVTCSGEKKETFLARLESTMQNLADVFEEEKGANLLPKRTFVTYNHRGKTISSAKKAYVAGGSLQDTPENCFYDLLSANYKLLLRCGFSLPQFYPIDEYLLRGPSTLFLYHPRLGPQYISIEKKLCGGSLSLGSVLVLEIADLQAKNLHLEGSLEIIAEEGACCVLENVKVKNLGVDWSNSSPFWKMDLKRVETLKIVLKKNSRFIAKDREFIGNQTIVVE